VRIRSLIVLAGALISVAVSVACHRTQKLEQQELYVSQESEAVYEEHTYKIAPINLGPTPCQDCGFDIPPMDPDAVRHDFGLDGRVVIRKFDARSQLLTVVAFAGGPVLSDPKAPNPKVQKTYLPEKPQAIPPNQQCVFWFSPYLQLTLYWEKMYSHGSHHVVLSGSWYRKTYKGH